MDRKITKKFSKIELVLTDVDGVLTDGGRYYSESGELLKKFHTRDGMGVNILLRNKIKTVIITKEKSKQFVEIFVGKQINEDAKRGFANKKKLRPYRR